MSHERLAPSGAYMWIPCPGQVRMSAPYPRTSSRYASEGTAAHTLGEECLSDGTEAHEHIGQPIIADGIQFTVDEDMADAVQVYLDYVRDIDCDYRDIEVKTMLPWIHPGLGGTTDCRAVASTPINHAWIVDYKHGKGKSVYPEWNPQLMIYALGAIHGLDIDEVSIVIVQPRVEGEEAVRVWNITAKELRAWGVEVLLPAARATDDPKAQCNPGDWCGWCPAKMDCPAKQNQMAVAAQSSLMEPQVKPINMLTTEQLVRLADAYDMFAAYAKEAREYMERQAKDAGVSYPGFKLVRRKSNRKWTSEAEVDRILGDAAFIRKIRTVKQMEDALKKQGAKLPKELWEKPDNGVTLVRDSDKRRAVASPAALAFLADHPSFG